MNVIVIEFYSSYSDIIRGISRNSCRRAGNSSAIGWSSQRNSRSGIVSFLNVKSMVGRSTSISVGKGKFALRIG